MEPATGPVQDTVVLRADQLRPGDLVDLEGDKFCDPEDGDWRTAHRCEFSLVADLRMETPQCLLLGFEGEGVYGVPPAHPMRVAELPTHASYPHEPGRLHDCPACDARCHCDTDVGHTECVYEGEHYWPEFKQ